MSDTLQLERKSKIPTFDQVPEILAEISNQNRLILSMLNGESTGANKDPLLTLDELRDYLPENPAKPTVYAWVNNRLVPFEKHGSRLYFRKSAIDNWLSNGRQML